MSENDDKKTDLGAEWDALVEAVRYEVNGILTTTIEGAAEDLEKYVTPITVAMTRALAEGKSLHMSELQNQLLALKEIHQVRFVKNGLQVAQNLLGAIFRVASKALLATLPVV